mmetsp:Transcript_234/g.373  ORF Transcript_234/g.373 Transcript_234/m.373 type:complete len:431 (+) Transcript_234:130-1422(+)
MSKEGFEVNPKVVMIPPMERFIKDWNKTQIPVEIKGIFIRHIADVNTIDQSFKIAVGFDMMWPSNQNDIDNWNKDPVNFTPEFVPNFEFPNAKEETLERRALENGNPFCIQEVDGTKLNFLRTLVYLTVIERLELTSFPFDVQELTLIMDMSFASIQKAMFVPGRGAFPKPDEAVLSTGKADATLSIGDFKVPLLILNRQYCTVPDFDVERCVLQFRSACYAGDEVLGDEAFRWGQVTIRIQLKRKAEGYLYRVAFYNLLLAYTSVCAFALNPVDGLGDRIGFLITLILAAVAFQFIVSQYLPNVSYLTLLDKYTFAVFTICCALLGVISYIGIADLSDEKRVQADKACLWIYLAVLTVVQLLFWLYGIKTRQSELCRLKMGEMQLARINYCPKSDTPIDIVKAGLLQESKKPMKIADSAAFVSFAGSAH